MNTLKVGDKIPTFECLDDKENLIKSENFRGSFLITQAKSIISEARKNR